MNFSGFMKGAGRGPEKRLLPIPLCSVGMPGALRPLAFSVRPGFTIPEKSLSIIDLLEALVAGRYRSGPEKQAPLMINDLHKEAQAP